MNSQGWVCVAPRPAAKRGGWACAWGGRIAFLEKGSQKFLGEYKGRIVQMLLIRSQSAVALRLWPHQYCETRYYLLRILYG